MNMKNEIVKRKSGEKLEGREKQIIFNVFNYLHAKNPELSISRTVEDTAEATGCSTQTIFRIRKEAISGSFKSPSKTKPCKNINKNSRLIKYDDSVRSIIRNKLHDCLFKNSPLTLKSVMNIINEDTNLPNFKRSTLHKILNEMGFKYQKKGKIAMYMENNDLINIRHSYIKEIRKLRSDKRNIFYIGEYTIEISTEDNQLMKYLIIQAANETGFLKNANIIHYINKSNEYSQYHDWIKKILLNNLPDSSVIIVDNSSQYRWKSNTIPDKNWQRDKIKEWLITKRIPFKDDVSKKNLLEIVNASHKSTCYELEECIKNHGHTLLKLPSHHSELSVLSAASNQIKQCVSANVSTCQNFEDMIWEALDCINVDTWRLEYERVLKAEENMWRADLFQNHTITDIPETVMQSENQQEVWFNDFLRIRGVDDYQQYIGDRE